MFSFTDNGKDWFVQTAITGMQLLNNKKMQLLCVYMSGLICFFCCKWQNKYKRSRFLEVECIVNKETEVLHTAAWNTLLVLTPQGTYCTVINLLSHPGFLHLHLVRWITLRASDVQWTISLSLMCFAKPAAGMTLEMQLKIRKWETWIVISVAAECEGMFPTFSQI